LDSCIRKNALLNLKWSDFSERDEGVMIKVTDKGNKEMRQLISHDFYKELLTIKSDGDKVFDISSDSLNDTFKRLKSKMGISIDRNIVFHSIRKTGVTFRYRITGDILEAKRAANHSSVSTTQIYLENEDYGLIGAVSSKGNLDMELYKKVDQETLLQAISMCKKDLQLILNMKIQEVMRKTDYN
jgi:integrase